MIAADFDHSIAGLNTYICPCFNKSVRIFSMPVTREIELTLPQLLFVVKNNTRGQLLGT